LNTLPGIAVLSDQPGRIKLADNFLRLELEEVVPYHAGDKGSLFASGFFGENLMFQSLYFLPGEERKIKIAVF
jgi:hypothetical protein